MHKQKRVKHLKKYIYSDNVISHIYFYYFTFIFSKPRTQTFAICLTFDLTYSKITECNRIWKCQRNAFLDKCDQGFAM